MDRFFSPTESVFIHPQLCPQRLHFVLTSRKILPVCPRKAWCGVEQTWGSRGVPGPLPTRGSPQVSSPVWREGLLPIVPKSPGFEGPVLCSCTQYLGLLYPVPWKSGPVEVDPPRPLLPGDPHQHCCGLNPPSAGYPSSQHPQPRAQPPAPSRV